MVYINKLMKENQLKLIRGARIVKQIREEFPHFLDETTYAELERDTLRFIPPSERRQFATDPIIVNRMEFDPFVNSNDLKVEATVHSNASGKNYDVVILFMNVTFEDSDQHDNISFRGGDKQEYHVIPININQSNVKVRCECLDFYWRFARYNFADGSLYGPKPPPYQKKTDRPPANMNQTPGVCKHIMKTVMALNDTGIITG